MSRTASEVAVISSRELKHILAECLAKFGLSARRIATLIHMDRVKVSAIIEALGLPIRRHKKQHRIKVVRTLALRRQGYSYRAIAKRLLCSVTQVSRILHKHNLQGTVGRPRKHIVVSPGSVR